MTALEPSCTAYIMSSKEKTTLDSKHRAIRAGSLSIVQPVLNTVKLNCFVNENFCD